MKNLILLTVLLLSISCTTSQEQKRIAQKIVEIEIPKGNDGFSINDQAYTLHFEIENSDNEIPVLVISIKLHNGSHYISPFAKRDFKGKFYMDLGDYTNMAFKDKIIENPRSVEEIDMHPFTNGTVNWVRVNTTYKQKLNIKSKGNFEAFGRIRFTIEPRCTLEEIPFAISRKNGVFKIRSPKC